MKFNIEEALANPEKVKYRNSKRTVDNLVHLKNTNFTEQPIIAVDDTGAVTRHDSDGAYDSDSNYDLLLDDWTTICELNGQRWLLGPEAPGSMNWNDAQKWCESVGGVLPPREILLHTYLNSAISWGFASDYYWSSSEYNSDNAWYQFFGNGNQSYFAKHNTCLVRAVKLGESYE